jgi:hypothetical protein
VFILVRFFQPSLIFSDKARSLPMSVMPERGST